MILKSDEWYKGIQFSYLARHVNQVYMIFAAVMDLYIQSELLIRNNNILTQVNCIISTGCH